MRIFGLEIGESKIEISWRSLVCDDEQFLKERKKYQLFFFNIFFVEKKKSKKIREKA